jgi:hypothetical protein
VTIARTWLFQRNDVQVHGKEVTQSSSTSTMALHKLAAGVAHMSPGVGKRLGRLHERHRARFVPQCHLVTSARDRCMTFRDSIIVRLRNA